MSIPVTSSQWKVASAWLVSKQHIDLLVAARYAPEGTPEAEEARGEPIVYQDHNKTDDQVGQMLWIENMRSLVARYGDKAPETFEFPANFEKMVRYRFTEPHGKMNPLVILKQVHCYEYQSNEHDGWESSDAKKYCKELEHHLVSSHKEYVDAPWGV
jgi:hypothetical protein